MVGKFLLSLGIGLLYLSSPISAFNNDLGTEPRHPEVHKLNIAQPGTTGGFTESIFNSEARPAKSPKLKEPTRRSTIETGAKDVLVAQDSHRAPLGPFGVANSKPPRMIEFETQTKLRTSEPTTKSLTGTLFVQNVPKEAEAEYKKAMELIKRDQTDDAVEALNRALGIFPDYFLALQAMGAVHVEETHYETALKFLTHAIEINPNADISFLSMGIAQLNLNRIGDCIGSLRQSARLNPNSASAHLVLGYALIKNGQSAEAEGPLQTAYKLGGAGAVESQLYLATAYEKQRKFQEAADALHLYLKHAPKGTDRQKIHTIMETLRTRSAGH